jgi:hypothetical protein
MTIGALVHTDKVFINHLADRVTGDASCGGSEQTAENTTENRSKSRTEGSSNGSTFG